MKKFLKEFKDFAMQGNVMDMAVGVIIGAAFKGIIDSLVNDIINPLIGIAFKTDFSSVVAHLPGGVDLKIGSFISTVINFILMALVLFLIVKAFNKAEDLIRPKEEEVTEEPQKSDETKALEEIIALLKEKEK